MSMSINLCNRIVIGENIKKSMLCDEKAPIFFVSSNPQDLNILSLKRDNAAKCLEFAITISDLVDIKI